VDSADPAAIGALARRLAPGLVVIGQETPLVAGVADVLAASGIACVGPVRDAAMIEGSKAFAKDVMAAAGIPTAAAVTARTPGEAAAPWTGSARPTWSRPTGWPRARACW
jgi:phosphoribosylamine--glycine ligase